LPEQAKVRAAWIAENVGEAAPPNYKVGEANVVAGSSDPSGGRLRFHGPIKDGRSAITKWSFISMKR